MVDTNTYMRRSRVIPNFSFTTAGKELECKSRREERSKSPGPHTYKPKALLKRLPSATIGNTKRQLMEPEGDRATNPGPSDYKIERKFDNGPKYHIAQRYLKLLTTYNPGPSDYNYDPNQRLKNSTRVTIGKAEKVSCLVPREKSPGPSCY